MSQAVIRYFPRKLITPITGGLALVIGVTGILLFFHIGDGLLMGAHEWLGMAFAAVMLIHTLTNWSAFTKHFKHNSARYGLLTVVLATAIFVGASGSGEGGGPGMIFDAVEQAPISTLASLFEVNDSALIEGMKNNGLVISDSSQNLVTVAQSADMDAREAVKILISTVNQLK